MKTIQKTSLPAVHVDDIELTAMLPVEMVESQKQLIAWCEKKINVIRIESQEMLEACQHARKMKWKHKPFERLYYSAERRLAYYEKVKGALEAGYYIVPNFDVELFAIRTNRSLKTDEYQKDTYRGVHLQKSAAMKTGEGEYRNPFPIVHRESNRGADGSYHATSYPVEWDEFEFPLTMAKPDIMKATSDAMALKIFDQIGVFPPTRKEDPVIIGQIILKETNKTKKISFMIAWHINTNMI